MSRTACSRPWTTRSASCCAGCCAGSRRTWRRPTPVRSPGSSPRAARRPGPGRAGTPHGPWWLARRDPDRLSIGPAVLGGSGPSVPGRPGGTPYRGGVPLTGSVAITVVAALLVLVGLVGILVPVLPGPVLVVAGIAVWAVPRNDAVGLDGAGRRRRASSSPARCSSTCSRDAGCATPGCPAARSSPGPARDRRVLRGAGRRAAPRVRARRVPGRDWPGIGRARAWPSARHALTAVGWSILIELAAALLATAVWVGALVLA